jgi:alpha-1,2-mannosyltransferase
VNPPPKTSSIGLLRASPCKRLWIGAASVALFIATVWTLHLLMGGTETRRRGAGLDFIAFYTAGEFVREGTTDKLYDLDAVKQYQHRLANAQGFEIGGAYGPWWNPPFYALAFVPLALMPYPAALATWIGINLLCFALACFLLCRMLPASTPRKSWALVPVLTVLSTPFIFALSHAQNTCTSLLILSATVTLWRSRREFLAGLVGGLLFYKPQLALVLAVILVLDLGWKSLAGYAVTGITLLLANLILLPGTLTDYLRRLPANVHRVQTGAPYLWEQHVTLKAFWRLLLQGRSAGETSAAAAALTALCVLALAALLLRAAIIRPANQASVSRIRRDHLIAATIVATPLMMPFYFDYDLLLLAVPAVLLAAERLQQEYCPRAGDAWLTATWSALYAWQMINTDVAERSGFNMSVVLLTAVSFLMIRRASEPDAAWVDTDRPISAQAMLADMR